MPHRINSLICAMLSLSLCGSLIFAQTTPGRPATGSARPVAKNPATQSAEGAPRTSTIPRTAREPLGRAGTAEESAESAGPAVRPAGPRQAVAVQSGAQGSSPQVEFEPTPPAIKSLLQDWERQTKGINSLYCPITRFEFDNVFATETRSVGKVYFQNPDQGRIDFSPADEALLAKGSGRQDAHGNPYKVIPGAESKWICTGKKIYILDMKEKQYDSILIPPQNQGQNITLSPLPFIFGMKADDATKRFAFRFGSFHNPDGTKLGANGKPMRKAIHIVAFPLHTQEAQEYREADVILDPVTFLPMNLRTLDPAGNKETVYSFDQSALKVNVKWGLSNPFRDPLLPGWTEMHHGNAEPEQQAPLRQSLR